MNFKPFVSFPHTAFLFFSLVSENMKLKTKVSILDKSDNYHVNSLSNYCYLHSRHPQSLTGVDLSLAACCTAETLVNLTIQTEAMQPRWQISSHQNNFDSSELICITLIMKLSGSGSG